MHKFSTAILGLAAIVGGCTSAEDRLADDPNYGKPFKVSAPFRSQEEEHSLTLCTTPVSESEPTCTGESVRCWVKFDQHANADLDRLTNNPYAIEYGSYWIEGSGQKTKFGTGFGHLGQYPCQVKMIEIKRFHIMHRDPLDPQ
jgi:hypothetical protein